MQISMKTGSLKNTTFKCDYQFLKLGFVRFIVSSCRAVVLPRFGGPEVLELRSDVEVPQLKPNEVLVRARAVSINPLDNRVSFFFGFWLFV